MMEFQRKTIGWPAVAGVAAVAAAFGFGASHWLAARKIPAAAPVAAAAPAADNPGAEVKIPAQYLSIAKIAVEEVGNGGLEADILTTGTVTLAPNGEAVIVARAAGSVTHVKHQLGDAVREGDVLASVESPEAATMAAERSAAKAKLELARKAHAREASLFAQGVTPRQDMEASQAALAVAESEAHRTQAVAKAAHLAADGKSVAVVSPIRGRISSHNVVLGAFVQPQTELFRVAGDGQLQVELALPAAEIGRVKIGTKASIITANNVLVPATVRAITPTASSSTRAATVVLTLLPPVRGLSAGEGVQARLHTNDGPVGMVVPEDAVQNVDGHDVLFVRTKDGFRVQPVLVGTRSHGMAQIVSGVASGQQVATRNAFLVKADMIKSGKDE